MPFRILSSIWSKLAPGADRGEVVTASRSLPARCSSGAAPKAEVEGPNAQIRRTFQTYSRRVRLLGHYNAREIFMDKEHLKGAADKVTGAVKDAAGKATGDKKMQAEGK